MVFHTDPRSHPNLIASVQELGAKEVLTLDANQRKLAEAVSLRVPS